MQRTFLEPNIPRTRTQKHFENYMKTLGEKMLADKDKDVGNMLSLRCGCSKEWIKASKGRKRGPREASEV